MTVKKPAAKPAAKKPAPKPAPKKKPPARKRPSAIRRAVVGIAQFCHARQADFPYTETQRRAEWLHKPDKTFPVETDCSGFVTLCYKWAGAPDPSGLKYAELGYTGTLLDHAAKHGAIHLDVAKAKIGDMIVFGPGTGEHVVLVIEEGADPLCMSHGGPGIDLYRTSQDGREPKRVLSILPI
jgi:cell wall-associated NlpC family hydrolase